VVRRRALFGLAGGVVAGAVGWPVYQVVRPGAASAAIAQGAGGSNYGWYKLDGCNREPYGVVNTFDTARDTITAQLKQLAEAGQQRLRVLVYHHRGADTGTVMDSTGGDLSAQNRQNLTDLLAAVAAAGFGEIQVSFLPIGDNFAANWSAWNEDLYQENWNLVHNLRPIIAAAGIQYRIDLCNEAVPTSGQAVLLQYAQRLWTDYVGTFGKDDTVGFSIIGMDADRIRQIPAVYQGNPPYLFDFHFYGSDTADEYQQFTAAHQIMNDQGFSGQGWTISEVYYDDAAAADNLHRAIADTGRTVFYLLQWPLAKGSSCSDVSAAPPADFGAYAAQGF
jgi:hypothetical protein